MRGLKKQKTNYESLVEQFYATVIRPKFHILTNSGQGRMNEKHVWEDSKQTLQIFKKSVAVSSRPNYEKMERAKTGFQGMLETSIRGE